LGYRETEVGQIPGNTQSTKRDVSRTTWDGLPWKTCGKKKESSNGAFKDSLKSVDGWAKPRRPLERPVVIPKKEGPKKRGHIQIERAPASKQTKTQRQNLGWSIFINCGRQNIPDDE